MAFVSPSPHGDADVDLSFEALTFGEDSGHVKKENKVAKQKKTTKKDRYSPQSSVVSSDAQNGAVYVHCVGEASRIDVQALLKKLEQFGVVKASYFKEKQNFGFVQFLDSSVVDAVIESINKTPEFLADGVQITAERGLGKGTQQAESFGASFSGMPFSPPTSNPMQGSTQATSSTASAPLSPTGLGTPGTGASVGLGAGAAAGGSTTSPVIEKPDTILVLKNLPFSLKQDQLQEILMAMNSTAPQSINLHFDNMGVFRGMAFIKYRLLDDAIKVYEALNGYDVGGRKVRVEYKRKNKGQQPSDIPPEWAEEEDLRKLWEQVRDFSNNPNVNEISFTPNLTQNQRKHIHTMAEKLKLSHYSNGDGDMRYICIKKSAPSSSSSSTSAPSFIPSSSPAHNSQNGFAPSSAGNDRAIDIKGGRRPRRDSENNSRLASSPNSNYVANGNGSLPVGSVEKEFRPRGNSSAYKKDPSGVPAAGSTPSDNLDWRIQSPREGGQTVLAQSPSVAGITIAPSRQPRGPDGSKGFSDIYRNARKHTCSLVPHNDNTAPEIPVV